MSENMIPGYEGICSECFEPVKIGEDMRFREGGRTFHRRCVEKPPNNGYYIDLERCEAEVHDYAREI